MGGDFTLPSCFSLFQKVRISLKNPPTFPENSPTFLEKLPTFFHKSPTFFPKHWTFPQSGGILFQPTQNEHLKSIKLFPWNRALVFTTQALLMEVSLTTGTEEQEPLPLPLKVHRSPTTCNNFCRHFPSFRYSFSAVAIVITEPLFPELNSSAGLVNTAH